MDDSNRSTRRVFLGGTLGVASAVWLAACDGGGGSDAGSAPDAGGGTDGGSDAGPMECNSIAWEMSSRHPPGFRHSIDVTLADVMAATERTYDITGDSRHPHTVVVTADHFAMIAAGATVVITSSSDGTDVHSHDVTLMCSAATP